MKRALPIVFAFAAGFVVHMFMFSDFLPNSLFPNRPAAAKKKAGEATVPTPEFAKSTVYIEYKNRQFNPKTAVSKVGNHILIRNMDPKELMQLDTNASDAAFFKSVRPYALSEQIDVVPRTSGTFKVINKEYPEASFTVIIKP